MLARVGVELSRLTEDPDHLARRRARLPPARGRLVDRLDDHAAEEEPGRRGARRGKAGLIGRLTRLIAALKGLPIAYNRTFKRTRSGLRLGRPAGARVASIRGIVPRAENSTRRDE